MSHLEDVIDDRLIGILCTRCGGVSARPIGWLSKSQEMRCPFCDARIFLNTVAVRQQIRDTERQLREQGDPLSDTATVRVIGQSERRAEASAFAGPAT